MSIDNDKALIDGIISTAEKSPNYSVHTEYRDGSGWYALAIPVNTDDSIKETFLGQDVVDALLTLQNRGFLVHHSLIINALKRRIINNEHSSTH